MSGLHLLSRFLTLCKCRKDGGKETFPHQFSLPQLHLEETWVKWQYFLSKKKDDIAKNFAGVATLILKSRKKIWNSVFPLIFFCSIKILMLIAFVTILYLFWTKEIVPNYHFMVFDLSMTSINELERTKLIQCKCLLIFSWYKKCKTFCIRFC